MKPKMNRDACYHFARIPNNRQGRRFVAQLRTFVNPGRVERVRVRATGGEKRQHARDVRLEDAKTLRVYLDRREQPHEKAEMHKRYDEFRELLRLREEAKQHAAGRDALIRLNREGREALLTATAEVLNLRNALATARQVIAEKEAALLVVPAWVHRLCSTVREVRRNFAAREAWRI